MREQCECRGEEVVELMGGSQWNFTVREYWDPK